MCGVRYCDAQHTIINWHCWAEDCFAIDMEWFAPGVHWQGNPVISEETSIVWCWNLLQLTDTLNTQFKYWEGIWHSLLKNLKCWRKSFAKFDSLVLNIHDAAGCSLEKLNFKLWTFNVFFFFYGMHHYECVKPNIDISLQSGRATTIASFTEKFFL